RSKVQGPTAACAAMSKLHGGNHARLKPSRPWHGPPRPRSALTAPTRSRHGSPLPWSTSRELLTGAWSCRRTGVHRAEHARAADRSDSPDEAVAMGIRSNVAALAAVMLAHGALAQEQPLQLTPAGKTILQNRVAADSQRPNDRSGPTFPLAMCTFPGG